MQLTNNTAGLLYSLHLTSSLSCSLHLVLESLQSKSTILRVCTGSAVSWHDLRSDQHLLLQRGLSAITVSGVCGQRVSWSFIALLGIQIAVGEHTEGLNEVLCKVLLVPSRYCSKLIIYLSHCLALPSASLYHLPHSTVCLTLPCIYLTIEHCLTIEQ